MEKNLTKSNKWSFERKALVALSVVFVAVLVGAWGYAMQLRQTVAANNAVVNVDPGALIEVEKIRNVAESQIASSRSYFLLGSKALFDKQKADKQALTEALVNFEKKYSLPQIPELVKKIETLENQHQDIFDQAMDFRDKQTESKIVGQFYQSKTSPIRTQINENLDEMVRLHNAELERARTQAHEAAMNAEVQIPKGMTWLTALLVSLFLGMAILVMRMMKERGRQLAERDRLYAEAQKAVLARDEVLSAISRDLKDPMNELTLLAEGFGKSNDASQTADDASLLKGTVAEIDGLIKDICDQKTSEMDGLTLRLDQQGIDEILDDARLMLQPLAKTRDVRLQFDSVNPPVLAFLDRTRVMRVLSSLVGNAIKFSPKHGKVVIKVRSDQQFVNISVTDSGPGIPEKQLAGLFDNFWQARKTAEQGAGIGLAAVKTIIEAHGGTVKVDSATGNGSTFTFSLPRRRPVGAHLTRPKTNVRHTVRPGTTSGFSEGPSL